MAELGLGIFEQRLGLEYLKRIAGALEQANEATPLEGTVLQTEILESPPGWEPVITRQTSYILAAIHHEGDRIMATLDDLGTAVGNLQAQDTAIAAAIAAENAAVTQLIDDYKSVIGSGNLDPADQAKLDAALANVQDASNDLATAAAASGSTTSAVEAADPNAAPATPTSAPATPSVSADSAASDQTPSSPSATDSSGSSTTPDTSESGASASTPSADTPSGDTWTDPAAGVSDVADSGSTGTTPASS